MTVKGKGDKMRTIPLVFSLFEEILLYLDAVDSFIECEKDVDSPLLVTIKGKRLYPSFVDRVVKTELAGVKGISGRLSPHVLRHSLATQMLGVGGDLNSIKEMLGHSSLAATQVYTHNSVAQLSKIYQTAHPRAKKRR
jgi:integrase/recombinase XerC